MARATVQQIYAASNAAPILSASPAQRGVIFSIPRLAYRQGDLLEPFEKTHFMDRFWELHSRDKEIREELFPSRQAAGQLAEIDVTKEQQIAYRFIENVQGQMRLLARDQRWTEVDLILWLDRTIPHTDIPVTDSQAFITGVVQWLQRKRGESLDRLIHDKYRLRQAVATKIDEHRKAVRGEAFAQMLIDDSPLEVTPELVFTYDPHAYPINRPYRGPVRFPKHYYADVGAFDSEEEHQCAQHIETLDEVEHWVRNPVGSAKAFWLQTGTDKFYPDFVCRLRDGRYLVVEYKGEVYRTNDDSVEKNTIGALWEKRSNDQCLFLMISNSNYQAIRAKIEADGRYRPSGHGFP